MTKRRAIITTCIAAMVAIAAAWWLLSAKETDVYSAVLAPYPQARPLLVSRPSTCGASQHQDGFPDHLLARFALANGPDAKPISLRRMNWNYDISSVDRISAYSALAARNFAASKGGALIYLSRVGFNEKKTEALFCSEASGGIMLHYLRLEHGSWKVVSQDMIAIS